MQRNGQDWLLVVFRVIRLRWRLEGFQRYPSAFLGSFDPGASSIDPFDDALDCFAAHQRHLDVVAGLGKRHDVRGPEGWVRYDKTLPWTSRTNESCVVKARYFHLGSQGPLMRREGRSLRPPIFLKPFPVWHGF